MVHDETVSGAFFRVASRRPDAIAVRAGASWLRYGELAENAERLAGAIDHAAAGGPDGLVGVLLADRGRLVAAMLGVLAAGRGFVILDPDDPAERHRFILHDAAVAGVVTDRAHVARLVGAAPQGCPLLEVEASLDAAPRSRHRAGHAEAIASVCYTSGSTGTPKGVMQTQTNLLAFARAYAATLGIRPDDRVSLLYAPGFSAVFMDVFGALLHGATLCAYDVRRAGVANLAAWLDRERIGVLHTVPTVFRRLCGTLPEGKVLDGIRSIDLGGEAVTAHDAALVAAHFRPDCTCWNHLAATEASVIAHYALRPAKDAGRRGLLPVGTPPGMMRVWIERDDGTVASAGESGRLVLSSPHVSPGYWRQPELTARHFSFDPDRPGWRVFRSDDLGRIDADGLLHFEGRRGSRVKLRGQSIDLAEVEAAVRGCPGIRDAAVVEVTDEAGEAVRLEAHVVAAADDGVGPASLRRVLLGRLPASMVPAVVRLHHALPQTSSGKIDHRALRSCGGDAACTPPAGDRERQVADVFASMLEGVAVGRETDFFQAGGDSLAAVDLLVRLSAATGREVPHKILLEHPTVAWLAAAIDRLALDGVRRRDGDVPSLIVPLRTTGRHPPLFLVHGRLGHAHASPQLLAALGDEQPLYGVQARGLDGLHPPHRSIGAMAKAYVAAIRSVQPSGPYFLGGLCIGSYVALRMADRLRADGEDVLPLLLFDPKPPKRRRWRVFSGGASVRDPEVIRAMLARRAREGRIAPTFTDPRTAPAAVEVALAFERAFDRHTPHRYDGEVFLLASSERLSPSAWGDPRRRRAVFSGVVHAIELGATHDAIFDAGNRLFARSVAECIAGIHGPRMHGRPAEAMEEAAA